MSSHLDSDAIIAEIEITIQTLISAMNAHLFIETLPTSTESIDAIECSLHNQSRELADYMAIFHLQKTIFSDTLKAEVSEWIKQQPGKFKHCGWRSVNIRCVGGTVIAVQVPYYARNCDARKKGKGLYPALCLLGIHDRCTPGLASEISQASAALCSLEEARNMLSTRGCQLNIKTVRNVVKRFAARARLAQTCDFAISDSDAAVIKGRRVVISVDGGRLRLRQNKRGPKTKKGRHRYHTDWREPKLMIIYIANEQGQLEKSFSPYLDGTMSGPDVLFCMLTYYLKRIGIDAADKLLLVADGARWIWDRIKLLHTSLDLRPEQIYELVDFYHAVEHLNAIAKLKTRWKNKARSQWVKKNRRRLKKGNIVQVLEAIKLECSGSKNKLLLRERNYFIRNQARMQYAQIASYNMPIGSGAIESAVRRVINLRLKSPCIFWNEDSANEMLMLRSYYKAGRWDMLKSWACQAAV